MVLVIGFLTITNIAFGYGLAIYVNKHYGTLMLQRVQTASDNQGNSPAGSAVVPGAAAALALSPAAASAVLEQVIAAQDRQAPAGGETAHAEPVDEVSVLTGIQEFRSQLAKMSAPGEETSLQKKETLAAVAN